MNVFQIRRGSLEMSVTTQLAILISLSVLLWSIGAPFFTMNAKAAQLTSISDTLVDSDLGVATKHTISFVATNAIYAGQTIKIQLDPASSGFSQAFSTATSSDIFVLDDGTATTYTAVGNYNGGSDENLTLTMTGSTIATSSVVTVVVGSSTALWTNPSSAGSRVVRIAGTMTNNGDTRVAIIDDVVVTASVDTIFTFTISGLATSSVVNTTATTTASSTATELSFGTLTPGVPKVLGQELTVATNARNGFTVTVVEDQNLTSSTGADIDLFANGATSSTPVSWTTPTNVIDQDQTQGHMGVTSNDADMAGATNDFTSDKFAGNFNTARPVFSHTGPADGTTQNKGKARVAFKIEIGTLQEAGTDYTNTLTYVATPVF